MLPEVELSKMLISYPSITPDDKGCMNFIANMLSEIGFTCKDYTFNSVKNFYFQYGSSGRNLCFAGHVDVVPPGDESKWQTPPFTPTIKNSILYGRGACDMKTAIAAFITSSQEFLKETPKFNETISILLTADEEGTGEFGTQLALKAMKKDGVNLTSCIVGEPTSVETTGDTFKVGRRGSISFKIEIKGKQGHVAYPHNAINPTYIAARYIAAMKDHKFDDENEYFSATNLELTSITTSTSTENVIPESVSLMFNIRFNNTHTSSSILGFVENMSLKLLGKNNYTLQHRVSGESFLTNSQVLESVAIKSIEAATSLSYKNGSITKSTSGGTSDARFIKNYCDVIELGVPNATAHKIDENVNVLEITTLKNIYKEFIKNYFLQTN